ncbi:MAG: hypothetical protein A2V81_01925 [Candidatus Abawacabacteria bacterium RBG_16_42_10]|uniref:SLH domain-containing protein n=1 Tax=Candidatus Abawacabacteria bacterium RBG_16_42_10 TaxID=1817814 RepID=A0A1F4XMG0_9BACT|nr:MAG: hypothetical protein A2V81_01925 [Candidatus Abawacabacteria bacterium RBG_16_42_10]
MIKFSSRFMALIQIFALILAPFQALAAANFPDVPVSHLHYQAVQYLRDRNIINGYPDGLFRPENVVTRAEILKIAANGASIATVSFASQPAAFPDVANNHPLKQYINWAQATGAVKGYFDGTFRPEATVTRGEAAKILLKINNIQPDPPTNYYFLDAPQTIDLAPYIYFAVLKNLIVAQGNIYGTGVGMKRGDVAEMMYRVLIIKQNNYAPFGGQPSSIPTPTVAAKTLNISIQNFAYNPPSISINKGDTLVWKNMDAAPHAVTIQNMTSGQAGFFDSGTLAQGQEYRFTFNQTGTFTYKCTFHPTMVATVTVQ